MLPIDPLSGEQYAANTKVRAVYQRAAIPSQRSPRTLEWYRYSLRWLPNSEPTQSELNDAVIVGCVVRDRELIAAAQFTTQIERAHGVRSPVTVASNWSCAICFRVFLFHLELRTNENAIRNRSTRWRLSLLSRRYCARAL